MSARRAERTGPARRTILIVDDHRTLRRGLAALIDSEPDLAVGGEAATGPEALAAIAERRPDLVIVDLALGEGDGLDLVKGLRKRYDTRIGYFEDFNKATLDINNFDSPGVRRSTLIDYQPTGTTTGITVGWTIGASVGSDAVGGNASYSQSYNLDAVTMYDTSSLLGGFAQWNAVYRGPD